MQRNSKSKIQNPEPEVEVVFWEKVEEMVTGERCINQPDTRCCPVKEDILLSPRPIRAKYEWRVGTKHSRCFVPRSAAAPAQVSAQRAPHEESTQGAACS